MARGQRTKPLSTRDTLAAPEPEREGGPRWAKTIKDDIVDLKLSSVNISNYESVPRYIQVLSEENHQIV